MVDRDSRDFVEDEDLSSEAYSDESVKSKAASFQDYAVVDESEAPVVICPFCGVKVSPRDVSCHACGKKLPRMMGQGNRMEIALDADKCEAELDIEANIHAWVDGDTELEDFVQYLTRRMVRYMEVRETIVILAEDEDYRQQCAEEWELADEGTLLTIHAFELFFEAIEVMSAYFTSMQGNEDDRDNEIHEDDEDYEERVDIRDQLLQEGLVCFSEGVQMVKKAYRLNMEYRSKLTEDKSIEL